ncbi:hypothetical protein AAG570_009232 [Ranatra chinensis]|uniref:Uncharacterized protein n=1 Tax=Ranatra chinensis TaxID=642074 RepID=A0ABD0YT91_9HEMI
MSSLSWQRDKRPRIVDLRASATKSECTTETSRKRPSSWSYRITSTCVHSSVSKQDRLATFQRLLEEFLEGLDPNAIHASSAATAQLVKERRDLIRVLSLELGLQPPKSRLKAPTIVDRIMHTSRGEKSTVSYFTACRRFEGRSDVRDILHESSPFAVPKVSFGKHEELSKEKKRPRRGGYLEPTFRGKQRADILERVFVPEDFSDLPQSKCDVDAHYFELVNGRRILRRFGRRTFVNQIRETFRVALTDAYVQDEIQHIKERDLLNKWNVSKLDQQYDKFTITYDQFLSEDFSKTTELVKAAQNMAAKRESKEKLAKEVEAKIRILKSSLMVGIQVWDTVKLCKEVLCHISPIQWQEDYDEKKKELIVWTQDLLKEVRQRYMAYREIDDVDLDVVEMLYDVSQDILELGPSMMFFEKTWQVEMVFREIELQNLRAMAHIAAIKELRNRLKCTSESVTSFFMDELKTIEDLMDNTENSLVYHRERSKYVEFVTRERMKDSFKDAYSGEKSLRAMALVQDLFENIIGANENNLDCVAMIRAIEKAFDEAWYQLSSVAAEELKMQYIMAVNKKKARLRAASRARQRRIQLERVLRTMKKSFRPPVAWTRLGKAPKMRSRPPRRYRKTRPVRTARDRQLEEEARKQRAERWERIKLFIDYSDEEDFEKYDGQFDLDEELKTIEEQSGTYGRGLSHWNETTAPQRQEKVISSAFDDVSSLGSDWLEWWEPRDDQSNRSDWWHPSETSKKLSRALQFRASTTNSSATMSRRNTTDDRN